MEQKQLDEVEESYVGEEFLDENDLSSDDEEVKIEEARSKKKEKKKVAKKKSEKRAKELGEELEEGPETEEKEEGPVKESKPETSGEPSLVNPWEEDDDEGGLFKEVSTWKAITGILVILLIFSVFTSGFNFKNGITGATVSLAEAEDKALNYVNNFLLQPPFTAELLSSEESGSLYKLTLSVAGQNVETYLTKDGKMFFPQGFALVEESMGGESTSLEQVYVPTEGDPVLGDSNAPVKVIIFSDFQCPFCSKAWSTVKMIETNFVNAGKVKLIYKDFPLKFHPEAKSAALAAECAHEQNKFWEYHDLLFERQEELSAEKYPLWAEELGLEVNQFQECLSGEKYNLEVEEDAVDGQQVGVSGTPTFFINGKMITGAQPYTIFRDEINVALGKGVVEEPEGAVEELPPVEEPVAEEPVVEAEPVVEELPPTEEVVEEEPLVEEPVVEPPAVSQFSIRSWKWRFDPERVTLKKGNIQLTLVPSLPDNSKPYLALPQYTFEIPALGVKEEVSGTTLVEFTANPGTYEFKCSSCDENKGMTGTLIIE